MNYPAVTSIALSVAAVVTASGAAFTAWLSQRRTRALARRYAEALALIVAVARTEPPVAVPELRRACERLLVEHKVTATTTTKPDAGGTGSIEETKAGVQASHDAASRRRREQGV